MPLQQAIIGNFHGSDKWVPLTTIDNQTLRDTELAKQCLNGANINRLTKLN